MSFGSAPKVNFYQRTIQISQIEINSSKCRLSVDLDFGLGASVRRSDIDVNRGHPESLSPGPLILLDIIETRSRPDRERL